MNVDKNVPQYAPLSAINDWPQRAHAAGYRVKALAQDCGVPMRMLERWFHEQKGETPHGWMHEQRMNGAVELLRKGVFVEAAARELGYEYAHHFSRDFKNHFGCCPSKFVLPLPDSASKAALNAKSRNTI